jgi:F-box-like
MSLPPALSSSMPPFDSISHSQPSLTMGSTGSAFSNLPTELVIYIFSLAASNHKPTATALARTCRLVREWIEPIIYRTVVLRTKAQSDLFERTVRSKDPRFFEMYLKHFAPVAGHEELSIVGSPVSNGYNGLGYLVNGNEHGFRHGSTVYPGGNGDLDVPKGCPVHQSCPPPSHPPHAWHAIKGVRSLLLSSLCRPTDESTGHARPQEVAIKGFVKARFFSYPAFEGVTHLFLCEVPMLFTSVISLFVDKYDIITFDCLQECTERGSGSSTPSSLFDPSRVSIRESMARSRA